MENKWGFLMKSKIKELLKCQKICAVYTDSDFVDKFAVGYFLQLDEKYFLMECIDEYGKNDVYFSSLIENIIKIEVDSEYLDSIIKLSTYYKQKRCENLFFHNELLLNFIKYIFKNKKLCTIEICNSGNNITVGFVKQIEAKYLDIEIISPYGKTDGTQTINIDDISHISCESMEETKISILTSIFNNVESI